jgi:hypothetical protein
MCSELGSGDGRRTGQVGGLDRRLGGYFGDGGRRMCVSQVLRELREAYSWVKSIEWSGKVVRYIGIECGRY